jgi:hypothetical protein
MSVPAKSDLSHCNTNNYDVSDKKSSVNYLPYGEICFHSNQADRFKSAGRASPLRTNASIEGVRETQRTCEAGLIVIGDLHDSKRRP